jgi:hypothetical protein
MTHFIGAHFYCEYFSLFYFSVVRGMWWAMSFAGGERYLEASIPILVPKSWQTQAGAF